MVNPSTKLSIKNLGMEFGTKVIHKNFNLDVYDGEILVLLGASGSGKSTLLRALIGLETPSEGECQFESLNLFSLNEKQWVDVRQKIAYSFQGGALFDSLTVEENLMYPLQAHTKQSTSEMKQSVDEILNRFGLPNTQQLLPASLSGGMQKRVGLARAMMLDPNIILYDEPTAGLDPANSRIISETILNLKKMGKTSILVTHDTQCAQHVADRLAYIHDKKIAAVQTIEEFLAAPHPHFERYFKGEAL